MTKYTIRERSTKTDIFKAGTLEEAKALIKKIEATAKIEERYVPDYWEIYDIKNKEVIS